MKNITVILTAMLLLSTAVLALATALAEGPIAEERPDTRTRGIITVGTGQMYTKLQDGVIAAITGDTIKVSAGTYNENVWIPAGKVLTVEGANMAGVVLDGSSGTGQSTLSIYADYFHLINFTIKGSGSNGGNAGIFINTDYCTVENVVLDQNKADGVYMDKADHNVFKNLIIKNSQYSGVSMNDSHYNLFEDLNSSSNKGDGFYSQKCDHNLVTDCIFGSNDYSGLSIKGGGNNTVRNTTITTNHMNGMHLREGANYNIIDNCTHYKNYWDGTLVEGSAHDYFTDSHFISNIWSGITMTSGKQNQFVGCYFGSNSGDGIHVHDSQQNQFTDLEVELNHYSGIYLERCTQNTIQGCKLTSKDDSSINMRDADSNTITQNELAGNPHYAVRLDANCSSNSLTLNRFLNNRAPWRQAYDNGSSNVWNAADKGNHWSDWTSPDADGDGIVDVPYPLDGGRDSRDQFPLTAVPGWPNIYTEDTAVAYENKSYSVRYEASDSDTATSSLSWSFATNASWLAFSDQHVASGTPKTSEIGRYWVNVSVSDGGHLDLHNFTLEVQNVNEPPVILTKDVTVCNEHQAYSVKYTAKDPDPTKDVLTWSVNTTAKFLVMDAKTGTLSGTPGDHDVGTFAVSVNVSDGKGGVRYANFTLSVLDVNDLPVINATVGDFSFPEDTTDSRIRLKDVFKDVDDALTFKVTSSGKSITASISSASVVTLTPKSNWNGAEDITLQANDTHTEISHTFTVTITGTNDPPKDLTITLDIAAYIEGGPQPAWANATDADIAYGDTLTYTWSSNVTGTVGTGAEVNLSLPAGDHTIVLNVTDGSGAWSIATKEVKVLPAKKVDAEGKKGFLASYWWVILIVVLIVIIIIVIIIIVVVKKKKQEKEKDDLLPEPGEAEPVPTHEEPKSAPPPPKRMRSEERRPSPPPAEYIPPPEPVPEPRQEPEPEHIPEPEQEPSPEPGSEPEPLEQQPEQEPDIPPAINEPRLAQKQLPPAEEEPKRSAKKALVDDLFSPLAAQREGPKPRKKKPAVIVKCYKCNGDIPLESESGPQIITCPHCGTMSQLD